MPNQKDSCIKKWNYVECGEEPVHREGVMRFVYIGIFLTLFSCGSEPRDQEMEEVGKIVLLEEESLEETSLERGRIAEAQEQEMPALSSYLEEGSEEQ